MKPPGLSSLVLSATLFLISTPSLIVCAQGAMSTASATKAAQRAEDLLKRYDLNRDGRLDEEERVEAKERMLQDQFERRRTRTSAAPGGAEQVRKQALKVFDRDGDGMLDEEERSALQKRAGMNPASLDDADDLRSHFDMNRDGKVDPDERAAMEKFVAALRGAGPPSMRAGLMERFDVNKDGAVDERELAALEKFMRPRIEASADSIRRYDRNRDGTLDDTEWKAARDAIAQRLNNPDTAPRPPEARPSTALRDAERTRLKAAAEEVARRRAKRAAGKE